MIVGNNIPIIEINRATCCESVAFEINKPNESDVLMKSILTR